MEASTPLFQSMLGGVHRLEAQELEEKKLAEERAAANADSVEGEPDAKKRRTQEDTSRRARRLVVCLASMANRCYLLSFTEAVIYLLTSGKCLQTHKQERLFTRQLH